MSEKILILRLNSASWVNCSLEGISFGDYRDQGCFRQPNAIAALDLRNKKDVASISNLLKVTYYHLVFTLPGELNQLALHKPRLLYNPIFKTAWAVVSGFAPNTQYLGAKTAMIAVLHTWEQNLSLHTPKLYC